MTKSKNIIGILLGFICLLSACSSQQNQKAKASKETLIVFHAGSLSVPIAQIEDAFEQEHPEISIQTEAAGSRQCARKICELNKACDVFLSADYSVIDELLIPEYATWNIQFSTNEMALVYTRDSRYAQEINALNWPRILLRDDVTYGRSNPDSDPCGYRALLTMQLAEKFYGMPGFAKKLEAKDQQYIRPKETDLLALLESHNLDYIFLYRSVAQQHKLPYLILPDSINLKNPKLASYYKQASTLISGKKPGEPIKKTGEPMIYGLTVPKNAPHYDWAIRFVQFLLDSNKGLRILSENGQETLIPSVCPQYSEVPETLKSFIKPSVQ